MKSLPILVASLCIALCACAKQSQRSRPTGGVTGGVDPVTGESITPEVAWNPNTVATFKAQDDFFSRKPGEHSKSLLEQVDPALARSLQRSLPKSSPPALPMYTLPTNSSEVPYGQPKRVKTAKGERDHVDEMLEELEKRPRPAPRRH
jgi:hypothetical protein